jgi:ABC-2 type transport system ATP-binding protein
MAILHQGHVLLCGEPARLIDDIEERIWARFVDKADLPLFQKQHAVISTRLRAGRTLIHVYDENDPGMGFEPAHASLEDVYFATIAGRHNAAAGNC